jgi:hypothetical protein
LCDGSGGSRGDSSMGSLYFTDPALALFHAAGAQVKIGDGGELRFSV